MVLTYCPFIYYYLNSKLINGIVYRAAYRLYRIASHLSTTFVCIVFASSIQIIIRRCRSHRQQHPHHDCVFVSRSLFTNFSNCIPWQTFETTRCTHTIAVVWATPTFKSQFRMWSARVMRTIYIVSACVWWGRVSLSCECIRINAFCRNNKTKWISDYEHPNEISVYNQYAPELFGLGMFTKICSILIKG